MIVIIYGVFIIYIGTMVIMTIAWFLTPVYKPYSSVEELPLVTILIAARNEESSILKLLQSISNNTYPRDKYEVIVVNDHSEDATHSICRRAVDEGCLDQIVSLAEGLSGKKKAIEYGILHAKESIVLMTDADCIVRKDWIATHVDAYMQDSRIEMAFGPVQYMDKKYTVVHKLLNSELAGLVGIGAGSLYLQSPNMINAANMSLKKSTFQAVSGFDDNAHIPTGDDEFLLRKVFKRESGSAVFLKSAAGLVLTKAPNTIRAFFDQRRRWASKWKEHDDLASRIVPIAVFAFNIILILSLAALIDHTIPFFWALLLLLKLLVDTFFVSAVRYSLGLRNEVWDLLILQIIYPFYVVLFGIASNFGSYQWKNRVYHTSASSLSDNPQTNHE